VAQNGKLANRKLVLVLAALLTITLVGLNVAVTFYFSETNAKNTQIQQLNDQLNSIEAQIANLNLTIPASAPNLISIGLQYTDNRTDPTAPFLHITGYVVNVGNAKAEGSTIHVFAIHAGNATAIDNSANIGSIEAGAYEKIDVQFSYSLEALTAYSSNLNWGT
jgi:hypothetical protein